MKTKNEKGKRKNLRFEKATCDMRHATVRKSRFSIVVAGCLLLVAARSASAETEGAGNRSIFPTKTELAEAATVAPVVVAPVQQPVSLSEKSLFESIRIPEEIGRVIEVYQGTSGRMIVHVQDAHVHYEAQKNLALIVEELIREYHINLVLIEGGDKTSDYSALRKLASKEKRMEVAERQLRKGLLNGEQYLELTTDYPMVVRGVEDMDLYKENIQVFSQVEHIKEEALSYLQNLKSVIEALKRNVYSPELKTLERMRGEYEKEQLGLVAYYEYLGSLSPVQGYPNLSRLLEASRLEKGIDFEKVDQERDALIDALTAKLSKEDVDALVTKSVAYRDKQISQKEYYEHLAFLADENEVLFETYPNLDTYIRYVGLYDGIDHVALFKEGDQFEEKIRTVLLGTAEQKEVASLDKKVNILLSLMEFKLSPDEYQFYAQNRIGFLTKEWLPYLSQKAIAYGLTTPIPKEAVVDRHLSLLDHFYQVAQKREMAFIENTMEEMTKYGAKTAVLKTGGFHTPGLTHFLREKGISYVVVSPKITEASNPELYHSMLRLTAEQLKVEIH